MALEETITSSFITFITFKFQKRLTNGGYTTIPFNNKNNSDINFANTLRSYDKLTPVENTDFFAMVFCF